MRIVLSPSSSPVAVTEFLNYFYAFMYYLALPQFKCFDFLYPALSL